MKLKDQVALVTGAGSGLGAALARALAAEGASLVLCGRRLEPLESLAAELGAHHMVAQCDVTDESEIEATVGGAFGRFGRLDILVNNAGIGDWIPFEETTTQFFDAVIATNLRGPFLCSRHAWPYLKLTKGQILNVSSTAGSNVFKDMSAYCASKWGLNGLSETLAIEGEPVGIRVMSLGPGAVDTDIWGANATPDERARMMKSEHVADLGLWLLTSPRNVTVNKVVLNNFSSPFAN